MKNQKIEGVMYKSIGEFCIYVIKFTKYTKAIGECMLKIDNLKKTFNKKIALDGINLNVKKGEVFGFIGRNGAGKSTTIKSVLGFVFPDSGEMFFKDEPLDQSKFRESIGYLPEIAKFPEKLTAKEFLTYSYSFYKKITGATRDKISQLLEDVGLKESKNKLINTFSKGMKQRLGIAQSVIHDPELLILDEPFTGLDPVGKDGLKKILIDQNKEGKTIFFSSHNLTEVQDICSVICTLHNGKVVYQGATSDFIKEQSSNSLEEAFIKSYSRSGGKDV
ncbi:MAG: ABC transporter ATP-binding protein [Candidatus Aureabacteria bacterium]|nr:ABC transporter ATP-binding protein [Candidatus Auribacterota bacterium]